MRPLFQAVVGRMQGGRKEVADRNVVWTIWSQGGFACCKWNPSATKSIVERFLVIARRSGTGRRLVGDWCLTSCSSCRQSLHGFRSLTDRRSIADRLPTGLQTVIDLCCYRKHTLKKQSPTDRQAIADRSATNLWPVGNCSPITRPHDTQALTVTTLCLRSKNYSVAVMTWQFRNIYFQIDKISYLEITAI